MTEQRKADMEVVAELVRKLDSQSAPVGGFMRWPEPSEEERAFLDRVLRDG